MLVCLSSALVVCWCLPVTAETNDDVGIEFFEQKIRPVLVARCYECHSSGAKEVKGGFRLDTRAGLRAGGDSGQAVVPHDTSASLLLEAIKYEGLEMPPDGKLPDEVIGDFERWIRSGASVPQDGSGLVDRPGHPTATDFAAWREFWAFQPLDVRFPPVAVRQRSWPRTDVDVFVLAKLESEDLAPAPEARRGELIRRLYFDLIGLPPTPEQVQAFVNDQAPDAYEQLVDRLLCSPYYGERWGQHWLDVVRYAETEGFEYDRMLPGAWRYRDYVIASLNHDKPYDVFVAEQLAGDEIDPTCHELRIAAGFHRLGAVRRNAGNQEVASSRNEVLTERTDIIGAAFLGLTLGCARCHDHKFDPIPQKDYYRVQAFLAATQEEDLVLAAAEEQQRRDRQAKKIESRIAKLKEVLRSETGPEELRTLEQIRRLEEELPPPLPTICSIRNVPDQRTAIHLLRRGDWDQPLERLGMRPLGVLVPDDAPELDPDTPRPRTELARWLTAPDHPLTARVIVNRVWQHHFGRGLVSTANDFGYNGARPTHPELLDYLARALIENGWRLKPVHRLILLSSVYRQSTQASQAQRGESIDPNNDLLWRYTRRRLSAEELRDAMLVVCGRINRSAGGPSIMLPVDQELIGQLYNPSQWQVTPHAAEQARRSVYLVAKRNLRLPFMEVFDQPPSQTSCPRRPQSTHAPQSLELLNGQLSNQLAEAFAQRLRAEVGEDHAQQIDRAYRLATGRAPTSREKELAVEFLDKAPLREFALAMFNLNAFLYVE